VAKAKKATNEQKSKQSKANDNKGAQFEAPNTGHQSRPRRPHQFSLANLTKKVGM